MLFACYSQIRRLVITLTLGCAACWVSTVEAQTTWTSAVVDPFSEQGNQTYPGTTQLTAAGDGKLYGALPGIINATTNVAFYGAVFSLTLDGQLTIVHSFAGQEDGGVPLASPIEGTDGNFYGTTSAYGANGGGTVYKMTPQGVVTVLYAFPGFDTSNTAPGEPQTGLVEGSDGFFYGTTQQGGANSSGTIFKIDSAGNFSVVASFPNNLVLGTPGTVFLGPFNQLMEADDGNYYGTSEGEIGTTLGDSPEWAIYKLSPSGALTTIYLHAITPTDPGYYPSFRDPLAEGTDGALYGTKTANENLSGILGSVFKVTPAGAFAEFALGGQLGVGPAAGLFVASDGNLYGTTQTTGLETGDGVIFRVTGFAGTPLEVLPGTASDGPGGPQGAFIQASDGSLYSYSVLSTTTDANVFKTVASPALAAPIQMTLTPTSVATGSPATLDWQVLNATSNTYRRCAAFVQGGLTTGGNWSGVQTGAVNNGIYRGSAVVTPSAPGTYTYALTCGGVESGFATLTVTGTTTPLCSATTVKASPNPASKGASVSLVATVTSTCGSGTPTGAVTFTSDDGSVMTTQGLNSSGTATVNTTVLPIGQRTITASYGGSSTFAASQGTGSETITSSPSLTVSPTMLTFAAQPAGTTSSAQSLMITNAGAASLAIAITIGGPNAADFSESGACSSTLAPGGSCSVNMVLAPPSSAAVGSVSSTLVITSGANTLQVAIQGAVSAAPTSTAGVSPTTLQFGSIGAPIASGTVSAPQTVTVTNTGSTSLVFPAPAVSIAGANGPDFAQTNGCDGHSLAVQATCTISVTFTASATVGAESATLSIASSGAGSPQLVQLSGLAGLPSSVSCIAPTINIGATGTTSYPIPCTATDFTGTVSFACNLPQSLSQFVSCSFNPTSISFAGDSSGTVNLTLMIPPTMASLSKLAPTLAVILCMPITALGLGRRRRMLAIAVALFVGGTLYGCHGDNHVAETSGSPPAGTYQASIVITGAGVNSSIPITITVQ